MKIDAETGQVVDKLNMIKEAATTGTGKSVLGTRNKLILIVSAVVIHYKI